MDVDCTQDYYEDRKIILRMFRWFITGNKVAIILKFILDFELKSLWTTGETY
jgi:hypothetical protein